MSGNGTGQNGNMDEEVDTIIARMKKRNLVFAEGSINLEAGADSYF
ncbi:MAG: hypothetical protein WC506_05530 [Candidatus Micrarchaeia archaeon]